MQPPVGNYFDPIYTLEKDVTFSSSCSNTHIFLDFFSVGWNKIEGKGQKVILWKII